MRRRHVFRGRVQGVGFRATTCELATRFQVGGFVRNQADGTVEVVVDGLPDEIEAFIAAIEARFTGKIRGCDVTDQAILDPPEPEFVIRY